MIVTVLEMSHNVAMQQEQKQYVSAINQVLRLKTAYSAYPYLYTKKMAGVLRLSDGVSYGVWYKESGPNGSITAMCLRSYT